MRLLIAELVVKSILDERFNSDLKRAIVAPGLTPPHGRKRCSLADFALPDPLLNFETMTNWRFG